MSSLTVVERFKIGHQLGTILMDKAYNNNTIMNDIHETYPTVGRDSRLCYSVHIINLVVKAILYGKRLTDFSRAIIDCSDDEFFVL